MTPTNKSKTMLLAALSGLLGLIMALTPLSGAQIGSLPPDPQLVTDTTQDALNGADTTVGGIEPTGLISPTALQANAVQAALEEKLNALKALYISGQLDLVDYEDVDLNDIDIREGVLPERMFFHTDLFNDLGIVVPPPPPPPSGGGSGCDPEPPVEIGIHYQSQQSGGNAGSAAARPGVCAAHTNEAGTSGAAAQGNAATQDAPAPDAPMPDEMRQLLHDADVAMRQFQQLAPPLPPFDPLGQNVSEDSVEDLTDHAEAAAGMHNGTDQPQLPLDPAQLPPPESFTPTFVETMGFVSYRDDDNEKDTTVDIDATDDHVTKSIALPSNALTNVIAAKVWMYANAYDCGQSGATHRLKLNGVTVTDYNPCDKFPTATYGWASIPISYSSLVAGSTNTIDVREFGVGSYTDRNAYYGVDSDRDYGRSDIYQANGAYTGDIAGEAMMYVETETGSGGGNSAPGAASQPNGPGSGQPASTLSYSSSATDPNGDNVRYEFNWGDGSANTWTSWVASGTAASASHSWSSTGTYSVSARAQDPAGLYGPWSTARSVTIASGNAPPGTPTQPSGPSSGVTGTSYTYSTSATDPNGNNVRYLFDWGDGTTTWTSYVTSGSTASASKSWTSAGTYQVRAQAQDSSGASSGWSTPRSVTISAGGSGASVAWGEDFEVMVGGEWSFTGQWRTNTCSSYSSPTSLVYNQGTSPGNCPGTYDTPGQANSGTATGPSITVPFAKPMLEFKSWYQTENTGTAWDTKTVWLSNNGGSSYTQIMQIFGAQDTWTTQPFDLAGYAGQSIRLRFMFETGDEYLNNFVGWRIDDVKVTTDSSSNAAPSPCFSANPTSGYTGTWFAVNAGCTTDLETPTASLSYRWDWEGDGTYDTAWEQATSNGHSYTSTGSKTIRLQVSDGYNTPTTTRAITVNTAPGSWFSDGFEAGSGNWDMSQATMWHITRTNAYTGSQSMWYGQESTLDYNTGATHAGQFTSPAFTIPSGSNPYLAFKSWYHTEAGTSHDKKWVQVVQASSGSTLREWQLNGPSQVWTSETFSLSDLVGQSVRLRFKFDTVDDWYNDYRGWAIDDVLVQNGQPLPEQGDQSVRSFSSEWTHSSVSTSGNLVYRNDDGSYETSYTYTGSGLIRKRFEVHLDDHKSMSKAYLGILAKSSGSCSDGQDHTLYRLLVNGQQFAMTDPCVWTMGTTLMQFYFSPSLLVEGFNTFEVVKHTTVRTPDRGISFATDTGSPGPYGSYSDIQIGSTTYSGELMWQLAVNGQRSYETLERYVATERKDANGQGTTEFGQEAFVYYEPAKLNTLFTKTRQFSTGTTADQWSSTVFQKNAYYLSGPGCSNAAVPDWPHYEFDAVTQYDANGGRKTPTSGTFYTWFKTQTQSMDENGVVSGGRYMQLVPAQPSSGQDRNCYQNPPPSGAFTDDNGKPFELTLNAYWKTCRTAAQTGKSDLHCVGAGMHLLDMDQRFASFAGATAKAKEITDWVTNPMTQPSMSKWLKASLKITMQGTLSSWFYSFAQTGDLASVGVNEVYRGQVPATVLSIVPPVIGWQLPVNPQVPFHWVPTPPQQYNWYYP